MTDTPDLAHDLARHVVDTSFSNLPLPAVDAAKKSILDTLGVIVAASGMEPAARAIAQFVIKTGGTADASVLGAGGRVPAAMAAFANGAMAHCLDFDDRTPWGAHPSSSLVPAAFAVAESSGGASGQQMIAAIAVGQDIFSRLRFNVDWRQDWNLSTVLGVFSAAAGAAYLSSLTREQVANALGLASMQSSGTMGLIYGTGSDLRGLYAGFTAKGAVLGVQLAQQGLTGIDKLFEGEAGIFQTYFGGRYSRDKILENLGTDYLGATTLYKPWPVVGVAHTYIHTTIELMKRHRLIADDIEQVRLYVGDYHERMCAPLQERRCPATAVDAKFSLPFCIAIAAAHGELKIGDFTPEALKDPQVLRMAQRVVPVEDKSRDWKTAPPDARMTIITRQGAEFELVGRDVPGSANAPLSWDDLARKFRDCARVGANRISNDRIQKVIRMVEEMEAVDDATDVLRLLS